MGGLLIQRCSSHSNCYGSIGAWGRRLSVSTKRAGFHVTGPRRGSLGVSFLLSDWQVRVFCLSGFVDRTYDRLYVHTISLSGFMERRSRYTGLNQLVNDEFTKKLPSPMVHNKWINIPNKIARYIKYTVISPEYDNYPSILIIHRTNVLVEVLKSHNVYLMKIMPYKKCIVLKSIYTLMNTS